MMTVKRVYLGRLALLAATLALVAGGCKERKHSKQRVVEEVEVRLTSAPSGAAVFEGERDRVGATPLTLRRRIGQRLPLTFVKDGYKSARRAVSFFPTGAGDHSVHVVMHPQTATLLVNPLGLHGVRIQLDGRYVGRGPRRIEVPLGKHVVELEKKGFLKDRRVVVAKNAHEQLKLEVRMVPDRAGAVGRPKSR